MYDKHSIPQYQDSFTDFLGNLRRRCFRSQSMAAKYFHYHRTTITRYENGDVYPPIGYIAHLALKLSERYEPLDEIRETLLNEVNRAIRGKQAYESEPPFGSWGTLSYCSREYIEQQLAQTSETTDKTQDEKPSNHMGYWGRSPDISDFQARETEMETLQKWIVEERCRLIGLVGLGGMGKSMLAKKVAVGVGDHFEYVVWISLQIPLTVEQMQIECIRFITQQPISEIPTDLYSLLNQSIEAFSQHRCLIILDDFKTIPDDYELFLSQVGKVMHKSCILVTSRQQSVELSTLERDDGPVRSLSLHGIEISTARMVLQGKGLSGTEAMWQQLVRRLSGNLLALEMTASTIRNLYSGDIARFLTDTDTLMIGNVRNLVAEQYEKLSDREQHLLSWLAVEQQPRLVDALSENLVHPLPRSDIFESLDSLFQRSLILRAEAGFGLHEIVQSYLLDQIITQVSNEILTGKIDVLNQYALLKAQSQEHIRQIQVTRILEPVIERVSSVLRREKQKTTRFSKLLESLRHDDELFPGYAAGNLFNLARHMNLNLSELNFSELPVWQAHMMGETLHNMQFRESDLRFSSLTQAFDSVNCLAFSRDGEMLATGMMNGDICVWNLQQRQQLFTLPGHNSDWITDISFSENQNYLYSVACNGFIKQWDIETAQQIRTIYSHKGRLKTLALAPYNTSYSNVLASGGDDGYIRLWDTETGELIRVFEEQLSNWIHQIHFHPNKPLLISCDGSGFVRFWDLRTGQCVESFHEHTSWVWDVQFSPDGEYFASCGNDGKVCVWSTNNKKLENVWDMSPLFARKIIFTDDGEHLVLGLGNGHIQLWSMQSRRKVVQLSGHRGRVYALALHPEQPLLVSSADDNSIRVWDLTTYSAFDVLDGYNNALQALAVSSENHPNGHLLASGGAGSRIHLWDAQSTEYLGLLDGHINRVKALAFNPIDGSLVSVSFDRTTRIWDMEQQRCQLVLNPFKGYLYNVAVSPDGKIIVASGLDLVTQLWDAQSGKLLYNLPTGQDELYAVAFDPNGKSLVVAGEDQMLWVWNLIDGTEWQTISGHTGLIWGLDFSNDGQLLASASSDNTVRLWQVESWEQFLILSGHTEPVEDVAFSPDDRQLASCGFDRIIRLWDAASGECLLMLEGHEQVIYKVAYIDERTLASCSRDGTVRVWNVETGECLHILRADRIYERMDITGTTGLTTAQRVSLKALGAVEYE